MTLSTRNDYKIIAKNFSYLTVMRAVNIGFKFFLVAYLIRVLGTQNYGLITWLDSIIQFFLMFINFGFNIYAAKYIVDNNHNTKKLNEITSSIYIIKTLLFLLSLAIVYAISFTSDFYDYSAIFILFIFCGVGEALFPVWYFQGKENLKPATIIVFISRAFLVISTLLFVTTSEDINTYVIILVFSSMVMGILGLFFLKRNYNVHFYLVPLSKIIHYLKEAIPFFFGRFMSLIFNFGTIFLIGKFCNLEDVTGFDACLKLIMVCVIPLEMLQQAAFPSLARTRDKRMLKKLALLSPLAGSFFALVIILFSKDIIIFFGGQELYNYIPVLKTLSILAPIISLTYVLGSCSLVAFGYSREYNISLVGTSLVYLILVFVMFWKESINFWNLIYLRVFADLLMCTLRLYYSLSRKTLIFK